MVIYYEWTNICVSECFNFLIATARTLECGFFSVRITSRSCCVSNLFWIGVFGRKTVFEKLRSPNVLFQFRRDISNQLESSAPEYFTRRKVYDRVGEKVNLEEKSDKKGNPLIRLFRVRQGFVVVVHHKRTHTKHESYANYEQCECHSIRTAALRSFLGLGSRSWGRCRDNSFLVGCRCDDRYLVGFGTTGRRGRAQRNRKECPRFTLQLFLAFLVWRLWNGTENKSILFVTLIQKTLHPKWITIDFI